MQSPGQCAPLAHPLGFCFLPKLSWQLTFIHALALLPPGQLTMRSYLSESFKATPSLHPRGHPGLGFSSPLWAVISLLPLLPSWSLPHPPLIPWSSLWALNLIIAHIASNHQKRHYSLNECWDPEPLGSCMTEGLRMEYWGLFWVESCPSNMPGFLQM